MLRKITSAFIFSLGVFSPLAAAPKDALAVKVTASSAQPGNDPWKAVDGDAASRWCAADGSQPQWLMIELPAPRTLTGCRIEWESSRAYSHKIEGSADGTTWSVLADSSGFVKKGPYEHAFKADAVKFFRITCLGAEGGWACIREISLKGPGIPALVPEHGSAKTAGKKNAADSNDPFGKEGNIAPKIVKLTPEQEAEILKDVKVADGFDVTLFANSQAANYPVFIAAAPDGTLYVSSDGNGSVQRNPHRGRIVRLRDTDGDGRADEVKEFVKDVDSPRGLVVDGNTVYCLHPPHLSAFIDKDGDGIADEEKVLVKNIAFTFKDRPADHTTNGMELGIDGWLYIACGDFGFMEAEGSDGRKLQLRGGGIIRVRPDGTNLQLYSRGTRNILDAAVSPLCDLFARDNTNDGDGWDVRFHHFTGFEDHGYPRLYKNFADEEIAPLADYGGGSGCGACWIDEPGWPAAWNNLPYTSDWGRGPVFRHTVRAKGATFEETAAPEPLVTMTRSTDIDVDARGFAYVSSWKGPATFGWAGPDNGYIVRIAPKGHVAPKVADFAKMDGVDVVELLRSRSATTRLAAQRRLIRDPNDTVGGKLWKMAVNSKEPLTARVAAIFAVSQMGGSASGFITHNALLKEPAIAPFVLRAKGEQRGAPQAEVLAPMLQSLASGDARTRKEAAIALARIHGLTGAWADGGTPQPQQIKTEKLGEHAAAIAPLLGDSDALVAHTAMQVLRQLGASDACFAILDDPKSATPLRNGALMVLRGIHDAKTVDGLIARLDRGTGILPVGPAGVPPAVAGTTGKMPAGPTAGTAVPQRQAILAALCRLHFTEGTWTGNSWGTRPDTRGPYYQPEAWSETDKIAAALKSVLASAQSEEAAFLVSELTRNRIQFNDAMQRILALAKTDERLIPDAVAQLATADNIPSDGVPLLVKAALSKSDDERTASMVSSAIIALAKVDSDEGTRASLAGLARLGDLVAARAKMLAATNDIADPIVAKKQKKDANALLSTARKATDSATAAFLGAPKLENHHQMIEGIAEKMDGNISLWADAALLTLSARKTGAPEPRELSAKALDTGWQNAKRRAQILKAAGEIKHNAYADKILVSLDDADETVAAEAKIAAAKMKLEKKTKDTGPLIGAMQIQDVIRLVVKTKGDIALGEQLFTRNTCGACHTTSQDQPQKGPYLGNIAQTYKRPDLAEAILDPNKTIAQGFATNVFTLKDGTINMGFVVREGADKVTMRNVAAQESTYDVKDIAKRDTLPTSIMPPGLVNNLTVKEFASLLDYLEELAAKK